MKKILITGANGFIGRALWDYIEKKRRQVSVFGTDVIAHQETDVIICDLLKQKRVRALLREVQPDTIFHFAGGRPGRGRDALEANFQTTVELFNAVLNLIDFHPRIIIPSSAAEYGIIPSGKRLLTENSPTNPTHLYGRIKLKQTQLALRYVDKGLDIVVARIFNIGGKDTPRSLAVGNFSYQIAKSELNLSEEIIRTKGLSGKRDFLDIEDVCRALGAIARLGQSGEVYNVCSGKGVAIKEILKRLLKLSKRSDMKILEENKNSEDVNDVVGSPAKLKSLSRWKPNVSLALSLRRTLQSYRNLLKRNREEFN